MLSGLRVGIPAAGLLAAAVLALTLLLADLGVRQARTASSPQEALAAARRAEDVAPWTVAARYLQARALEELGDPRAARDELLEALALEPRNSATLGLLGDLAARRGDRAGATGYYREALALNPRDVGLRQLAR
jgi:tetratricopeptide (TPR) repeat protein